MPFSIVAVLILVLSSISIVIIYSQSSSFEPSTPPEVLEDLRRVSKVASEDVHRMALSVALEVARQTRDMNESALQERFDSALRERTREVFPCLRDGITVDVQSLNLALSFLWASLEDDGGSATRWTGSSVPAYFSIGGNVTVNASCPRGHIAKVHEISDPVYLPIPLLLDRGERLAEEGGVRGDIEALVRYELSALAQDRVLRGYGSSSRDGSLGTAAVITDEDVVRAINLALVLEGTRLFRSPVGSIWPLEGYMGSEVDPADIFLRSYDEGGYDLAPIAAQSINGMIDQLTLRMLDYLGIVKWMNDQEAKLEGFVWTVTDALDWLTGGDTAQASVVDFVRRCAEEAGHPEYQYRWLNYGSYDVSVNLPANKISFMDDTGRLVYHNFQGTYLLDFQPVDVMASPLWGEFIRTHNHEAHDVAIKIQDFLTTLSECIASSQVLPKVDLSLDPQDGQSYLEEMTSRLRQAFLGQEDWVRPALLKAQGVGRVQDGYARAINDFMLTNWQEITRKNESVYLAVRDLSWRMAEELNGTPNFGPGAMAQAQTTIFAELLGGHWGSREILYGSYDARSLGFLNTLSFSLQNRTVSADLLTRMVTALMGWSVGPALQPLVRSSVIQTVDQMEQLQKARNDPRTVRLTEQEFVLRGALGTETIESFEVGFEELTTGGGQDGTMQVEVTRPWEIRTDAPGYPNLHVTDLLRLQASPFLSQWDVSYSGAAVMPVEIGGRDGGSDTLEIPLSIELSGRLNVVVASGWALQGVEYLPSATLDGDIGKALNSIWSAILRGVEVMGGGLLGAFDLFSELTSALMYYALEPVEQLSRLLMDLATAIQDLLADTTSALLKFTADVTGSVLGGTVLKMSALGFDLELSIEPGDSAITGAVDRIRVEMSYDAPGATVSGSLHLLRMPLGDHALVGEVRLEDDNWMVRLAFDPLNAIYGHVVEGAGYFGDRVLEIALPDVETVNKVKVSLAQVPLLGQVLQNLPSPLPGTKGTVDVGFELGLSVGAGESVVINEVEMNPAGLDAAQEWVELYNPTDRPVSIAGWQVRTCHGDTGAFPLPAQTISPGGRVVYVFPRQALDNGNPNTVPSRESVVLIDDSGQRVDAGPWLSDPHNDDRTWQRAHDGGSRWVLEPSSCGRSNGAPLFTGDLNAVCELIISSAEEAFREVGHLDDLDDLSAVLQATIRKMTEKLIGLATSAVSYFKLFFQVGATDLSSAVEGGICASVIVTGSTVRQCLLAMVDRVHALLSDPLNPTNVQRLLDPFGYVSPEDLNVQLAGYTSISVPGRFITMMDAQLCQAEVLIRANVASLELLDGVDRGRWRVEFGALVSSGLTSPGNTGASLRAGADVWLMRCSLSSG